LRRIAALTNANSVITRYGYGDCGALTCLTNAFGVPLQEAAQYIYDYQSRHTGTVLPDGNTGQFHLRCLGPADGR